MQAYLAGIYGAGNMGGALAQAACRAVFLAEDDGGEGELLDFILKGTMRR